MSMPKDPEIKEPSPLRLLRREQHEAEKYEGHPFDLHAKMRAERLTGRLIFDYNQGVVYNMQCDTKRKAS